MLEPVLSAWDQLAVEVGAPFGSPAWSMSWWRHRAPARGRLAVATVHDEAQLIGLAPFYSVKGRLGTDLRLLSGGFASRLGVLAKPGREAVVATAVAHTLAQSKAPFDSIHWESVDLGSPLPASLTSSFEGPGRFRLLDEAVLDAPIVRLDHDSYADWLAAKSRNFRAQTKRNLRTIDAEGGRVRVADRETLRRDLDWFQRLHAQRWDQRGGSTVAGQSTIAMLEEVGHALIEQHRFRLWMIEGAAGEVISAQVFVGAGGELAYWNGGFDERRFELSPGLTAICAAIEDAYACGDRVLDLGGGAAGYKHRLADENRPVRWASSYRLGRRYPLARLRRFPEQFARNSAPRLRARLGSDRFNRLRRLLSR